MILVNPLEYSFPVDKNDYYIVEHIYYITIIVRNTTLMI